MAFKTILLPFICFLVSSTAEQNCSEYQYSLVPVGEDLSSEFQFKASEDGVKLVYLQVKIIGNDSYGAFCQIGGFIPDPSVNLCCLYLTTTMYYLWDF